MLKEQEEKLIIKPIITNPPNSVAEIEPPIKISKGQRYNCFFKPMWVKNPNNPNLKIDGKLVYVRTTTKNKINRNSIRTGEMLEFSFNSQEIFNLYEGLEKYYTFLKNKDIPKIEEQYININNITNILGRISSKQLFDYFQNITNSDILENLKFALNITELEKVKKDIEDNLSTNKNESYWQKLFSENAWILSQIFSKPLIKLKEQAYLGGKNINNNGGTIADFLFQNSITKNITVIEIKTPSEQLITNNKYREKVYSMNPDLINAVNQLLIEKQTLNNEFLSIRNNSDSIDDSRAINIDCLLVIGNMKLIKNDKIKLDEFENFRNELRSIEIITFDEILNKIELMIKLLKK